MVAGREPFALPVSLNYSEGRLIAGDLVLFVNPHPEGEML
jgi:hypothetical protein